MLNNWNASGKKDRVRGPRPILHIVDVRAVNANQRGALFYQKLASIRR